MNYITQKTATIALNGTTSSAVDLEVYDYMGVDIPTITSASGKIEISSNGEDWRDVRDGDGSLILRWTTPNTGGFGIASRDMADISGYKQARLVLSVAQAAARSIIWTFKVPRRD